MHRIIGSLFLFCAISLVAPVAALAITIPTVPVGNAGNAGEVQSQGTFGAVGYDYRIGTTEVSNAQYVAFLNMKGASDPLGLYNTSMSGSITRSGSDGSYTYVTITGRGAKPVNLVSWYNSIRFANWLHNGQGSGNTETGAYTLLGGTPTPTNGLSITRNAGATWFLPSENEWYKAAFHKNDGVTANYFDYPTSSDTAPRAEAPPGGGNSANYAIAVGGRTDVGAYSASDSPYGTFDQGGNLWEWNEALIDGSFGYRGLRGGSSGISAPYLSASQRIFEPPEKLDGFFGFRVATVPEPSTAMLAIMACGLMRVLRKRFK